LEVAEQAVRKTCVLLEKHVKSNSEDVLNNISSQVRSKAKGVVNTLGDKVGDTINNITSNVENSIKGLVDNPINPIKNVIIMEVKDGKVHYLKTIAP